MRCFYELGEPLRVGSLRLEARMSIMRKITAPLCRQIDGNIDVINPIIEIPGVINALFIENERVGDRANLQEAMLVAIVSGQPGFGRPQKRADFNRN